MNLGWDSYDINNKKYRVGFGFIILISMFPRYARGCPYTERTKTKFEHLRKMSPICILYSNEMNMVCTQDQGGLLVYENSH